MDPARLEDQMKGARQLIVELTTAAGCDLPDGSAPPPMDVAEQAALAITLTLADFARSLGLETDAAITRSTVPPARSLALIRLHLIRLHLALAHVAVELGIEDLSLIEVPADQRRPLADFLHRLRTQTPTRLKPLDP